MSTQEKGVNEEGEKTNQSAESVSTPTQEATPPTSSQGIATSNRKEQESFSELTQELASGETHETTNRSFTGSKRIRDDVGNDSTSLRIRKSIPAIKSKSSS